MSPASRNETPERVLQAAVRSLAAHGYAKTTARSIAASGGFAPGVIYYHFSDLDEALVATAEYTSAAREQRYREALLGVTSATTLIDRLRVLYEEDAASGHIEAVQELVAAARPGTPLARLIKVPVAARAAVAYYLGMQTLTHLDGDAQRPRAAFDQAARLAAAFDKLPKLRRRGKTPS